MRAVRGVSAFAKSFGGPARSSEDGLKFRAEAGGPNAILKVQPFDLITDQPYVRVGRPEVHVDLVGGGD